MNNQLNPPDAHRLSAAEGWLELGNHHEANVELENITPKMRAHPDVLAARWEVCRRNGKFDACLDIAEAVRKSAPDSPQGWILVAHSLYHFKRYQDAYNTLQPALAKFPRNWLILYDLGCYACLLGLLAEARTYLDRAFTLDTTGEAEKRALDDPDLDRVWRR